MILHLCLAAAINGGQGNDSLHDVPFEFLACF